MWTYKLLGYLEARQTFYLLIISEIKSAKWQAYLKCRVFVVKLLLRFH